MIDMECEHRQDTGAVQPVKIVVGNKCDLKEGRVVLAREGLEWARGRGCGFMETSAREMVNVEETFAREWPQCVVVQFEGSLLAALSRLHSMLLFLWLMPVLSQSLFAASSPPDELTQLAHHHWHHSDPTASSVTHIPRRGRNHCRHQAIKKQQI